LAAVELGGDASELLARLGVQTGQHEEAAFVAERGVLDELAGRRRRVAVQQS